jgi:hypothetical protein
MISTTPYQSRRILAHFGLTITLIAVAPAITLAGQAPAEGSRAQPTKGPRPFTWGPQRYIALETAVREIESGPWKGKRLRDGQPDIAGDWSNTIADPDNFTDPQGWIPGDPEAGNYPPLPARSERAPSRVSDPPDGQVPFRPESGAQQQDLLAHHADPVKPEYVDPLARCAPAGIPRSLYWKGYEIRQYPGYVVFLFDSGTRIIQLDGTRHLRANIKLWNGDSRGHWEGNTLVVDVSNLNSKARFARTSEFASENVHIVERYIFSADSKRYNYVATFTDPTVFTRPFTVTIPARRWTLDDRPNAWHFDVKAANTSDGARTPDHFERICVENNEGFGIPTGSAPTKK